MSKVHKDFKKQNSIFSPANFNVSTYTEKIQSQSKISQSGVSNTSSDYFSDGEEQVLNRKIQNNKMEIMDNNIMEQLKKELDVIKEQQEVIYCLF
jgi:hypothetical protein